MSFDISCNRTFHTVQVHLFVFLLLRKAVGMQEHMSILIKPLRNYAHNDTQLHSLMTEHPFHADKRKCNHAC